MKRGIIVVVLLLIVTGLFARQPAKLNKEQTTYLMVFANRWIEIDKTKLKLKVSSEKLAKIKKVRGRELKPFIAVKKADGKKVNRIHPDKYEEIDIKYCVEIAGLKVIIYNLKKKLKNLKDKFWKIE